MEEGRQDDSARRPGAPVASDGDGATDSRPLHAHLYSCFYHDSGSRPGASRPASAGHRGCLYRNRETDAASPALRRCKWPSLRLVPGRDGAQNDRPGAARPGQGAGAGALGGSDQGNQVDRYMWDRSTRYGELAFQLQEEICSGPLSPGDKLPSIRALCARFQASSATVTHALYLLEDAGMISVRPRSGFYVRERFHAVERRPPARVPEACLQPALPAQRALLRSLEVLAAADQPMLFARINPELYPAVALQRIMTEQARRNPAFLTGCLIGPDSPLHRQLARRGRIMGCDWHAEDITITLANYEVYRTLFRSLTQPGQTVAIASPAPMRLLEELDEHGLKVLEIPSHPEHGLSIDTLEFALRREKVAACAFSANFPHPTGGQMSDAGKRRVVELLAEHGVPLIEDDRNGDLHFGEKRPLPFKAFDRTGLVHYFSDVSGLVGHGLSIGFAVTNLRHEFERIAQPPELFQYTLSSFMASGLFEPHLRRLRQALASYSSQYQAAVRAHFPREARSFAVSGGHWMWIELPRGFDTTALLRRALQDDIAFSPGQLFCTDGSLNHCLRLNTGMPVTEAVERDIAALGAMIAEQLTQMRSAPREADGA